MGFHSIIDSYYTLPAPGRYMVTVKKGSLSFVTELMVNENSVIQGKLPVYMKGTISILWHCQMTENENANKMLVTI